MGSAGDERAIFLITGPSGAGKTTVARALAARFERGAHVEGDVFRRSIVAGRHELTPGASSHALEQLKLRYRLGAAVADAYFQAGFSVALEDVVGVAMLASYAEYIRGRPLHLVMLRPKPEVAATRDAARPETGYADWSVGQLYAAFEGDAPCDALVVDNSEQTVEQTVDAILDGTTRT